MCNVWTVIILVLTIKILRLSTKCFFFLLFSYLGNVHWLGNVHQCLIKMTNSKFDFLILKQIFYSQLKKNIVLFCFPFFLFWCVILQPVILELCVTCTDMLALNCRENRGLVVLALLVLVTLRDNDTTEKKCGQCWLFPVLLLFNYSAWQDLCVCLDSWISHSGTSVSINLLLLVKMEDYSELYMETLPHWQQSFTCCSTSVQNDLQGEKVNFWGFQTFHLRWGWETNGKRCVCVWTNQLFLQRAAVCADGGKIIPFR